MKENQERGASEAKEKKGKYKGMPLVYSCSGCSSVAQLANALAVRLDREELAEMSCIAGVGGGVKALVKTAKSQRPILALDGCPLHCARRCLEQQGVEPTVHVDLSTFGLRKRFHEDALPEEQAFAWEQVIQPALERIQQPALEHAQHAARQEGY